MKPMKVLAVVLLVAAAGPVMAQSPSDKAAVQEALRKGEALDKQGDLDKAKEWFEKAAKLAPDAYGEESIETAAVFTRVARFYIDRDTEAEMAVRLCRRSLDITEAVKGEDAPETADRQNDLGEALLRNNDPDGAETAFTSSLKRRQKRDPGGLGAASSYDGLARVELSRAKETVREDLRARYRDRAAQYLEKGLAVREKKLGRDHLEVAANLARLADVYRDLGKHEKEEEALTRCLAIRRDRLPSGHPDRATVRESLADLYLSTGRTKEAVAALREAVAEREQWAKDNPRERDKAIGPAHKLAGLLRQLGEFKDAEPVYLRLAELDGETGWAGHEELGRFYLATGRYPEGRAALRKAAERREANLTRTKEPRWFDVDELADLYFEIGQPDRAEALLRKFLDANRGSHFTDRERRIEASLKLANFLVAAGQYAKAEALSLEVLRSDFSNLSRANERKRTCAQQLALLYRLTGRYEKVEPIYQKLVKELEAEGEDSALELAVLLDDVASFHEEVGRYAQAEPLRRKCVELVARRGAEVRTYFQRQLALHYYQSGEQAKAEAPADEAVQIAEQAAGKEKGVGPVEVAAALRVRAIVRDARGEREKAAELFRRAADVLEKRFGPDSVEAAGSLSSLAIVYSALGRAKEARELLDRALKAYRARFGEDSPDVARCRYVLAYLQARTGALDEAAKSMDLVRRATRRHVVRVLPALTEADQLTFLKAKDEGFLQTALALALRAPGEARRSAAWLINGKGVTQEALAQRAALARAGDDPKRKEAADELRGVRRRLGALVLTPAKPGTDAERLRELAALGLREQELARALGLGGGAGRDDPWVGLEEVSKALPAGAVFLDIARFEDDSFPRSEAERRPAAARYAAWVTTATGDVTAIDLGPAAAIEAGVRAARKALDEAPRRLTEVGEPLAEKEARKPLADLAKLVLDPLRKHLDGAERWVVCPDGELWLVPWAALPLDARTYAAEKHTIRLVVSGRDLLPRAAPPGAAKPPAVFGDPDFGPPSSTPPAGPRGLSGPALGRVPRLPGTAAEARTVAGLLKDLLRADPQVFTGGKATTAAFRGLSRPGVLTLSTHGYFLPDRGLTAAERERLASAADAGAAARVEDPLLRCGLLLAGCNRPTEQDTGVLTGREILSADLRGCQLVVLGACETGLGDVRQGEGVAGLRQAFQLAGAESVLATLWKVPDLETSHLITDALNNLSRGKDRADALRQAQLERIRARQERFGAAHPFFWAAFTLTGDDGPLAGVAPLPERAAPAPKQGEPRLPERELLRQAPRVIKYLQGKGYANVGVLKFLVSKDGDKFGDNAGTLNMLLARRLEVALLVANDPRRPLGIVADASAVARKTRGANHLNREDRLKLFEARYPLAWGDEQVTPDAFLTGTAAVSEDLRTLTISLFAFDRKTNKLEQILDDFVTANAPDRLAEMGESFLVRGGADDGEARIVPEKQRLDKALEAAARVKGQRVRHPAENPSAPVRLEVRYDGKPVPFQVRGGRSLIPQPREGQQVELVLRRDGGKERYGCVLKVNGENTLYRQKLPDGECVRWVLDPGDAQVKVRGYQADEKTVEKFRVLSVAESKEREVNYGEDVGTITLTVFRELKGEAEPPELSDEAEEAASVGRAQLPGRKPINYHALKASLLEEANRGLLVPGAKEEGVVQRVTFRPDPIPVMTLTIVYYRP
jgi:CHAT domain-containing protein